MTTVSRRVVLAAPVAATLVAPLDPAAAATPFYVGGTYGSSTTSPAPWETRIGQQLGIRRTFWRADQVGTAVTQVRSDIAAGRRCSEISFKGPASWAQMARGVGDAWMRDIRSRLAALLAGNGHVVKLILHHEPENDTGTNVGTSDRGRDQWMRWQDRAADIFAGVARLEFGLCLMGYYCFYGNQGSRWHLDNCVPDNPRIQFVSFDIYQKYGTHGSTSWTDFEGSYFSKIGPWCAAHGKAWGLSEFGITQRAFDRRPTWFTDTRSAMLRHGGSWMDYFNTTLNNTDPANPWGFTPGDSRDVAYAGLVSTGNL